MGPRLTLAPIADHPPIGIDDQEHDAAVVAPVIERDEEDYLLFTRRSDDLGNHPGQMSFPGGGAEPKDESILATALREANEEIGLEPDEAEVVGQLDDIRTISEYAVTPFVARVPDREYERDGIEVAEIVVLPLSGFLDPANYECERRDHPYYGDIVIHYFHVDGYTVWGATGRILVQLLELTTEFEAPERIDRSTL
ncbi:CoA pyrophosphatase [Natronococcus sp. A-GB7]|jgi:8-oxo-dGTP pyrophosphatase MutT (NUDIX family)|uniref:NUDIX hydrolase n=1 Tax=Natronococcus sp. A-GB7 TaxID=3037649 RepID=UPI00241CC10B|nr:CoA pyrophosphatase [Natronococcus sp. A-GB7]MDG5817580.1 CoA pyrophosphatase [Natronococcus sp. A-GB7]